MPSISKQAIAYHEAGHAVANNASSFKIKKVTIVPKGKTLGSVISLKRFSYNSGKTRESIGRWHNRIVSAFAGREAQRRFQPRSIRRHQTASDDDGISNLLLSLHPEEKERNYASKYLELKTRNLVNHHWRQIQDLAKALLDRQTLSGEEVKKVLRASLQAQRQEDRSSRHR